VIQKCTTQLKSYSFLLSLSHLRRGRTDRQSGYPARVVNVVSVVHFKSVLLYKVFLQLVQKGIVKPTKMPLKDWSVQMFPLHATLPRILYPVLRV
jgi:hypothetical protein